MRADDKVIMMTRAKTLTVLATAMLGMAACGSDKAEEQATPEVLTATDKSAKSGDLGLGGATVTPGAPFKMDYRIIGSPVVGSPVTVDLNVKSMFGSHTVDLEYRFKDATSMMFAESQPRNVRVEPAANEVDVKQQVTVIPQREGRFYLNVAASYETENGTMSTITAIPIQVGAGMRELEEHGEVQVDEDGESVRVLSND